MNNVYLYVLDTLADWEYGHVMAELNSGRFFKNNAASLLVKTVGATKDIVRTMGGIGIVPDLTVDDVLIDASTTLILPGADAWDSNTHQPIVEKARLLLDCGGTVAAICGATLALANEGLLDNRRHTSNAVEYLTMFSPNYKGAGLYVNERATIDNNLITASAAGALLWTKYIIKHLDVFTDDILEAWCQYFETSNPAYLYELIQAMSLNKQES